MVRVPGDQVAHQSYHSNYNCTIALLNLEFAELYISGWTYCETGGVPSENAKLINFAGGPGDRGDYPQCRTDQYPVNGSGHLFVSPDGSAQNGLQSWTLGGNLYPNQWNRIERYMKQGTPGGGNGATWIRRNLQHWSSISGTMITEQGPFTKFFIGHYFRTNNAAGAAWMDRYWDELYVDNTLARVEIGNASSWDACTHREIQIPSTWSQDTVTVTVRQGTFAPAANAFLFVVDSSGTPSAGYPVQFGAALQGPGQPGQPIRQ